MTGREASDLRRTGEAQHNRSTEAEIGRKSGLINADVEALEQARDARPVEPIHFE